MSSFVPEVQIRLRDVSIAYRLARQKVVSFKDFALHWIRQGLGYETLWALKDVSLTVERGEVVGIIGRNGAGKSTLLKVMSRVLQPIRGAVDVQGRLVPVLELGAGFDHELTGLENIWLGALLLGRSRKEVRQQLEAIVAFSGLGDFVLSPIRQYSAGMRARLGFAVATAWRPDILLLDEVLAVGDAGFVQKCEERLSEFREGGTTIVLVSHSAEAIRANCTRCLWLDAGSLRADGPTEQVLDRYLKESLAP
jgi:homopolymeric O-antigen transport system ATP-binding protein